MAIEFVKEAEILEIIKNNENCCNPNVLIDALKLRGYEMNQIIEGLQRGFENNKIFLASDGMIVPTESLINLEMI